MTEFRFRNINKIPENRLEDVKRIREKIIKETGIYISSVDTYQLWEAISDDWCAGWLVRDVCPEGQTFQEFIEHEMEKYGIIMYD